MSQERSFTHWSLTKLQHLQHLQHLRCQTHWLQHRSTTCQGNSVDLWTCGSVKHRSRLHWSCQDQTRTTVDSVDSWSQKIQKRSSSKPALNQSLGHHKKFSYTSATPKKTHLVLLRTVFNRLLRLCLNYSKFFMLSLQAHAAMHCNGICHTIPKCHMPPHAGRCRSAVEMLGVSVVTVLVFFSSLSFTVHSNQNWKGG
jgi:hypothetical protein